MCASICVVLSLLLTFIRPMMFSPSSSCAVSDLIEHPERQTVAVFLREDQLDLAL